MAIVRAVKTGVWSDTTVWNTGSLPLAADDVYSNTFTVTVDIDVTVLSINNNATTGVNAGGAFITTGSNNRSVTATNGFTSVASTTTPVFRHQGSGTTTLNGDLRPLGGNNWTVFLESSGNLIINGNLLNTSSAGHINMLISSGGNVTVNGNVTTISSNNPSITNASLVGTLTINGNITFNGTTCISNGNVVITGNITANGGTVITNTSGTVTITGNCVCNEGGILTNVSGIVSITGDISQNSVGSPRRAVEQTGNGVITIIGNLSGCAAVLNTNSRCIVNTSNGIINITGVVGSGTSVATNSLNYVVHNTANGTINITGTINGSSLSSSTTNGVNGVRNSGLGTINITGNVNGNTNSLVLNSAVYNTSTGVINISGNAIGGSTGLAVANDSTGTINLNGNAIGGTAYQAIEGVNAAGTTLVEKIVFGANGQTATRGYIKFKNTVNISAETVLKTDSTTTNLVDINVVPNLQPSISDVRLGVTYSSGSLTGTMNVPPFNAVKSGVPVDNGVGTAALTPQDVWNVLISGLTQSGSIGERLKNVATVETTGTQIASFNV
jgi:hypothetical protein